LLKSRLSGIPFWEQLLNAGHRVTAVAGTDNHNADLRSDSERLTAIGAVTTVIFADSLAQNDLLDGLRNGRAFIDLEGSTDRLLELHAVAGSNRAMMGESLITPEGSTISLTVSSRFTPEATIELYRNGELVSTELDYVRDGELLETTMTFQAAGEPEWVRVEVVSATGKVLLISNPVYINFQH
jgi:hypothetical protein